MNRAIVVVVFVLAAQNVRGQGAIAGTEQRNLSLPKGIFNTTSSLMADRTTGQFRVWWSCGDFSIVTGLTDGICYGVLNPANSYTAGPAILAIPDGSGACDLANPGANANGICDRFVKPTNSDYAGPAVLANSVSAGLCDLQDPTVVLFQGTYYMYAGGTLAGSPGCPGGSNSNDEHAAIYGFSSPDGVNWTELNGGYPLIQAPGDPCDFLCYTWHGDWTPSAVVLQSGSSCNPSESGSPIIRVYYSQATLGYSGTTDGVYAADSTDGVCFTNQRLIMAAIWEPNVKNAGVGTDYPLVMTYTTGNPAYAYTAVSNLSDDTSWIPGNGGAPVSLSPASVWFNLEGDQTGRFDWQSGDISFWWAFASENTSYLYCGQAPVSEYFPSLSVVSRRLTHETHCRPTVPEPRARSLGSSSPQP